MLLCYILSCIYSLQFSYSINKINSSFLFIQGNYEKLKEIWSLLELTKTKPNIQVYAATFECLVSKKEACSIDTLQELSNRFFSDVKHYFYLCLLLIILHFYIIYFRDFHLMIYLKSAFLLEINENKY